MTVKRERELVEGIDRRASKSAANRKLVDTLKQRYGVEKGVTAN